MPIPKPAVIPTPRRRLREVVYEGLRAAIEDGTLLPGERLADDDLVQWFGTSRTPIREAIAQLEMEGLIELASNRFTRVMPLSRAAHDDAADLLSTLHASVLKRTDQIEANTRREVGGAAAALLPQLEARNLDGYRLLLDLVGQLAATGINPLLTVAESSARARTKFHSSAEGAAVDWEEVRHTASALISAADDADHTSAAAASPVGIGHH